MRRILIMLCAIVLVSSFASTSFAKERRDRDNRHDKKIHVAECLDCQSWDRHYRNNNRSDLRHHKQHKINKQHKQIAKQQRKINKQQRKIARLQERRHQQRLDNYYNYSNQHRRDHRHHDHWAATRYYPNHHRPQVVIPVPPLPRIVIHFPW